MSKKGGKTDPPEAPRSEAASEDRGPRQRDSLGRWLPGVRGGPGGRRGRANYDGLAEESGRAAMAWAQGVLRRQGSPREDVRVAVGILTRFGVPRVRQRMEAEDIADVAVSRLAQLFAATAELGALRRAFLVPVDAQPALPDADERDEGELVGVEVREIDATEMS